MKNNADVRRGYAGYALVLFLGMLFLATAACERSANSSPETVDGTPVAAVKILGAFYPIEGTHYQLATISTGYGESGTRSDLTDLFSYGRSSDYGVYNYVFLDVNAESVYALLPGNDSIILSINGYPAPGPADPVSGEKIPVAWWLYAVVKEDTNQDGQLSSKDRQTLAISDVGGRGYTELIPDVEQILADVFKDQATLLLVYRSQDKNYLAHIDLSTRAVTKTTELPSFGGDVK